MNRPFSLLLTVLLLFAPVFCLAQTIKTPAESKHFTEYTDPVSGVVSYVLKPGRAQNAEGVTVMNQQTLYVTNPSMSSDGRFLWFLCHFSMNQYKTELAVLDLMTDEVHYFPSESCRFSPMVDQVTGDALYATPQGIFRRPADPSKETVQICGVPEELAVGTVVHLVCHLTMSSDRTKLLLDSRIDDRFFLGTVEIATGKYTKWAEFETMRNHAQFNPVREEPVFICKEFYTEKKTGKFHSIPTGKDGVYERMWLFTQKDGEKRIAPLFNRATHESWLPDGSGLYYCDIKPEGGVIVYDLDSGTHTRVVPGPCTHTSCNHDGSCWVYDQNVGPWYRGCSWTIRFFNTKTQKFVPIVSVIPAYNDPKHPSLLHPDPHPQFVAGDRYIAATFNVDGKMTVLLTPTGQLMEKSR